MPIKLECTCGKVYNLKDELAGKRIACKVCGQEHRVSAPPIDLGIPDRTYVPNAAAKLPIEEPLFEAELDTGPRRTPTRQLGGWPADSGRPYIQKPRVFENPLNGHQVTVSMPFLWCLLFGCFYFLFKSCYKHAIISFFAALCTVGLSWLVYPFFAGECVRGSYFEKGWRGVA